ncbi:MAG: M14 family zinc carboxypeptidase [Nocardioides sp.]
MSIRSIATAVAALALAATAALTAPATADPETVPNGPWTAGDDENVNAIHSYDQLWSTLESIEGRAQGTFDLRAAPLRSNTERKIPVVTIGDGPTSLMFIANQHGNEYVVSEGMLSVIRAISGGSAEASALREALTVTIVPRVNVDGFDADVTDLSGDTTPWRQNYDTECPGSCAFYEEGRGYDINRYHSYSDNAYDHPYMPGDDEANPVPEAIAMRLLWDELQPELVVDFHHQGTYVDDEGGMITGSVMWPNAEAEAELLGISEQFAETVTDSKRAVSQMLLGLEQYGYANITRYPSTTFPGIARNAYGLLGSASVLFEARGDMGAKSNGYITKQTVVAAMSVLESAADGSLWTASTEPADNIRERGEFVSNPHE